MSRVEPRRLFQPQPPDDAGVVSWVHLGDLHMTKAGKRNHLDLAKIVDEINTAFSQSVSFVFLPGDIADDGSRAAYAVVRGEIDRLKLPWCAIVGDHDVHEKSFSNFLDAMAERTHYSFAVGKVRFVAMNAFDVADPGSFVVNEEQLAWAKEVLQTATNAGETRVLLLHCYPSDLKAGGDELMEMVRRFDVALIDMGHTHYNEIANDGWTLYSATRSIGQIEEGPVGYSITNLDAGVLSWRFVELGTLPLLMITSPVDERLLTKSSERLSGSIKLRAKVWAKEEILRVSANLAGRDTPMRRVGSSQVWEAVVSLSAFDEGMALLSVVAEAEGGRDATDTIRFAIGDPAEVRRAERDQDNALGAWPEHGLLGTKLGPNKNGKKW